MELNMRTALAIALVIASSSAAFAQYGYGSRSYGNSYGYGTGSNSNSHYVNPYVTRNGSQVDGHYRTNRNDTTLDNYGTRGNYNPYTGRYGTRNPW
jgi:hypothetical protein